MHTIYPNMCTSCIHIYVSVLYTYSVQLCAILIIYVRYTTVVIPLSSLLAKIYDVISYKANSEIVAKHRNIFVMVLCPFSLCEYRVYNCFAVAINSARLHCLLYCENAFLVQQNMIKISRKH